MTPDPDLTDWPASKTPRTDAPRTADDALAEWLEDGPQADDRRYGGDAHLTAMNTPENPPATKPLGLAELMSGIGDDKLTFQRIGSGYFKAQETTRDCTITFATAKGTALQIERNEVIGLVVWIKQKDYDAMLSARKPQPQPTGDE